MEPSRIPVREWLWVMYKISVSRKGISSLQLAKELDRPQKTTWYMLQRIKEACGNKEPLLSGVVEADEKYLGGKESNQHESRKRNLGRGSVGKQPVLGMREREGDVVALPVPSTDANMVQGRIRDHVVDGSTIYTDEHGAYAGPGWLVLQSRDGEAQGQGVRSRRRSHQFHRKHMGPPRAHDHGSSPSHIGEPSQEIPERSML